MKLYAVATMDIVGSKKIIDRKLAQNKLIGFINAVNNKYAEILAIPSAITLGDEWQLITDHPWKCYDLIHEFQQMLWKDDIDMYAGIGIGTVDTNLSEDIRQVDGSCFHMAREAINVVKDYYRLKSSVIHSNRNKVCLKTSPQAFSLLNERFNANEAFCGNMGVDEEAAFDMEEIDVQLPGKSVLNLKYSELMENIINTLIENNEILKKKMTQKQKKIYVEYMKVNSYRKIAGMNISGGETISGISQKLNTAEFFTIQHNHKAVSDLIYILCKSASAISED